jgi:SAM-dependent methyltransferase
VLTRANPESTLFDQEILPLLSCPRSGQPLTREPDSIVSQDGHQRYPITDGTPDLRCAPQRYSVDYPWYEPWDEIDQLPLSKPAPQPADDLPDHLDAHLAAVFGQQGHDRLILEIGCGARQCEAYFKKRNFRYVGTDVDCRGMGPHVFADAHNLPFQDQQFDFYLSTAVYEHLVSPMVAAREAFRVLKPGGMFVGNAAFVYGFHDRASFYNMSHAAILSLLRTVGFEDVRVWEDWPFEAAISDMEFGSARQFTYPWRVTTKAFLSFMTQSFIKLSNVGRRLTGRQILEAEIHAVHTAGALAFSARKPRE